jgi:hypothetical protein
MLVSQHSAVGEDEACGGFHFFVGRAELAGHFCQGVHAVIVACSAEGGQAAEEGEGGCWREGQVVAGEFGDDGEAAGLERVSWLFCMLFRMVGETNE